MQTPKGPGCTDSKGLGKSKADLQSRLVDQVEINEQLQAKIAELEAENEAEKAGEGALRVFSKAQLDDSLAKIEQLESELEQKQALVTKLAEMEAEDKATKAFLKILEQESEHQKEVNRDLAQKLSSGKARVEAMEAADTRTQDCNATLKREIVEQKEVNEKLTQELCLRKDRDRKNAQMEAQLKKDQENVDNLRSENMKLKNEKEERAQSYSSLLSLAESQREQLFELTGNDPQISGEPTSADGSSALADANESQKASTEGFDQYDLTLDITSLKKMCRDKEVQLFQSAQSVFNIGSMQRLKIVAVLGLFDKGKSFLINKLFGKNLPHGKLHTTLGLRFLYLQKQNTLVIDSQGVQATVSYTADEETEGGVDPTVDAQMTESLVFAVISELANHVIFVCNDLTWSEQKYLDMLGRSGKSLVIAVHNMQTTIKPSEAARLFDQQIAQCYRGDWVLKKRQQEGANVLFFASEGNAGSGEQREILHVGIAKEGTRAGELYNKHAYDKILDFMDNAGYLIGKPKVLSEEIAKVLQKFLPSHLCLLEESGKKTNQQVQVKEREPTSSGTQKMYGSLVRSFTLAESHQTLSFDAVGATDGLGFVYYYPTNFKPLTNEYTMWENGTEMRYFVIEAPGITEDDLTVEELDGGEVHIKMMKKKFIDVDLAQSYVEDDTQKAPSIRQSDGPYHTVINLFRHETTIPLYTLEHGMFVMKMKRRGPSNKVQVTELDTKKSELSVKLQEQKTLANFGHTSPLLEDQIAAIRLYIASLEIGHTNKAKQPAIESKDPPHEEFSTSGFSIQSGSDVQMSAVASSSDATITHAHPPPADRTALESKDSPHEEFSTSGFSIDVQMSAAALSDATIAGDPHDPHSAEV